MFGGCLMEFKEIHDGILTNKVLVGLDFDNIDVKCHMIEDGNTSGIGLLSEGLDFLLLLFSAS